MANHREGACVILISRRGLQRVELESAETPDSRDTGSSPNQHGEAVFASYTRLCARIRREVQLPAGLVLECVVLFCAVCLYTRSGAAVVNACAGGHPASRQGKPPATPPLASGYKYPDA